MMSRTTFELVGHDNPLGRYPAPVVPIGRLNGSLVVVYAAESGSEVFPLRARVRFIRHGKLLKESLKGFDYRLHRLFAFGDSDVEFYPIQSEAQYFRELLRRPSTSHESPFFRLSIAKGAGQPTLVVRELISCLEELRAGPSGFVDLWYEVQRSEVPTFIGSQYRSLLPSDWRQLLTLEESSGERARARTKTVSKSARVFPWKEPPRDYLPQTGYRTQAHIHRVTKAGATAAGNRRVVVKEKVAKHFAGKFGLSRAQVRNFFEELSRLAMRELRANGAFTIPGFGKLVLTQRRASEGRHPATGKPVKIRAERELKFLVGKRMKDAMTGKKSSRYK
jgi:DNA-binding protein HU-beta